MKLKSVRVRMFRNILDSTDVDIENKVTCLVGKNESGKTAFLQALWRLNPARRKSEFSVPEQYPAWLEKRHRLDGKDLEQTTPIEVHLEWQPDDVAAVEEVLGPGVAASGAIMKLYKTYSNEFRWESDCSEEHAVKNFLSRNPLPGPMATAYASLSNFSALNQQLAKDADTQEEDDDALSQITNVHSALKALMGDSDSYHGLLWSIARKRLPQFFYFADYSKLPYTVKIHDVLSGSNHSEGEATARALLRLGGTENEYMLDPDYERRKRELENVANVLTDDVNNYWTQNPDLRVEPDITMRTETRQNGQHAVLDEMKLRIRDNRHSLTLPFSEHSAGFQWFFSFLAAFSEYERKDPPVVILLDEPAVGLHAKAQADFLRFIEERLTKRNQVIYTTHSPFMVQPGKLERVRLVEDRGKETGSVVTSDVLTRDRDTLFPLQGALGYDLVQHLFVAENNLVVEGTSDYAYIKIISDFLVSQGRVGLDPAWSIVPVGGADLIPTFVALLGNHLKLTVLVDSRKEGHQKLDRMSKEGYLEKQRIILIGDLLGRKTGDIEDFFEVEEYLDLYNRAFGKSFKASDLNGSDPVVTRIARHENIDRYDHGRPADVLLRERENILSKLSKSTLDRFENLFERINNTLGK